MEQQFCQSCGMPLTNTNKGTNADGSLNEDYCTYCYQNGKFTQNLTMSQIYIQECKNWTFISYLRNEPTGSSIPPKWQRKSQITRFPF